MVLKYWPLIGSALVRKPAEGLLTFLAVAAGFTLLALMIGMNLTARDLLEHSATWQVVGVYAADGVITNELIGDVKTLAAIEHRGGYGSVQARLDDPSRFEALRHWLTTNPALAVTPETQLSYYRRIADGESEYFTTMAYLASAILSLGALLGSVNIFCGIVSVRAREMATLRAIGYGALPVAASVVFEALLLALIGALAGAMIAGLLFDGREIMVEENVYPLVVSPQLVGSGIMLALVLALLGSLPPSMRAGRQPVIQALRAQ